ncbi:uncharacterized protein LOC130590062 [Beta vulgaris subsp. vulgaris]|uniref:uncharacterized protein LOC130590062 n=1 Tax=Beta vulgaris subsp. vulgaris TaxID=3555 RepID=UPI002546CB9E|nr:uncharacterized protein LOC130590062 [Beta vulgaris subsp. vulgaris]
MYDAQQFHRRFRMRKELFLHIVNGLEYHSPYIQQGFDALGRNSLYPLQKFVYAIWLLAYGVVGDAVDEYMQIAENTRLTVDNTRQLLQIEEAYRSPGMLGGIDYTHWQWDKCPMTWQGQYTGGSNNDINVLDRSSVFDELLEGQRPEIQYTINGRHYNIGYYLADGIYPEWPVFVKTIPRANMLSEKRKLFSQHQEGASKDIERAFRVFQKIFAIVCNPIQNGALFSSTILPAYIDVFI